MAVLFFKNQRDAQFPHLEGVAFCGHGGLFASGLNRGGELRSVASAQPSMEALVEWVARTFGDVSPETSMYEPGTYYFRMWRPLACTGNFYKAISQASRTSSAVALRILFDKLIRLFETIEPTGANKKAYGHRIRELLLLACMEVESSWSAVLRDNGYRPDKRFNTNDYVKLREPMMLDAYELTLTLYPSFSSIVPFAGWTIEQPTNSLVWYDAYNKTKHNREDFLCLATLENAVSAVGAAFVMYRAQFGFDMEQRLNSLLIVPDVFRIGTSRMQQNYQKGLYIPKVRLASGMQRPEPSWEWQGLQYSF
jgi:hypothetical protein